MDTDLKKRSLEVIHSYLTKLKQIIKLTLPLVHEKFFFELFHKGQFQDYFYSIFISVICFSKFQKILIFPDMQIKTILTHTLQEQSMYQLIYTEFKKNSFSGFLQITWYQMLENVVLSLVLTCHLICVLPIPRLQMWKELHCSE